MSLCGQHTSFVTLFCPPNKQTFDIVSKLNDEITQSTNIKCKTNRKQVIDSISGILEKIKTLNHFKPNGRIFCSGKIDGQNQVFDLMPPYPLQVSKYVCGPNFEIQELYDIIDDTNVYGIIQYSNKEASISILRGESFTMKKYTSGIPSKHNQGGQSQARFARIIQQGEDAFIKKIGEEASKEFLPVKNLKKIFVAGPGLAKHKFASKNLLDYRLRDLLQEPIGTCYNAEEGIREIIQKISNQLNTSYQEENELWAEFQRNMILDKIEYGYSEVLETLNQGKVKTLYLMEN